MKFQKEVTETWKMFGGNGADVKLNQQKLKDTSFYIYLGKKCFRQLLVIIKFFQN